MTAVQPVPIIINNTRERECILQDGRKYCETVDATPQEAGFMLLTVLGLVAWIFFAGWLAVERDQGWLALAVVVIPVVVIALGLILFGGTHV